MHERYGYIYEIMAIIIIFINKKTIIPCIVLNIITMVTYSAYLYGAAYNSRLLATINLMVYAIYVWMLMPVIHNKKEHSSINGEKQKYEL